MSGDWCRRHLRRFGVEAPKTVSRRSTLTVAHERQGERQLPALWETHHIPANAARPPGAHTREEREVASRENAYQKFPISTSIGRVFADSGGNLKTFRGEVYDFCDSN